jgi:quinol monooxygenase YgiN
MSDETAETAAGSAEPWSSLRCEKLTARPGRRDALVAALRRGADQLRASGCELGVRPSQDDPDVVWLTEAWSSTEARATSRSGLAIARRALHESELALVAP